MSRTVSGAQLSTFWGRTVGLRTVGPPDSWAPKSGMLGPKKWNVGPRTVGPGAIYKINWHLFPKCWQHISNINHFGLVIFKKKSENHRALICPPPPPAHFRNGRRARPKDCKPNFSRILICLFKLFTWDFIHQGLDNSSWKPNILKERTFKYRPKYAAGEQSIEVFCRILPQQSLHIFRNNRISYMVFVAPLLFCRYLYQTLPNFASRIWQLRVS